MLDRIVMARQLLVPLKRHEHVGDVIPYLEKISQPGMKVVFLFPLPVRHRNWWRDRRISRETDAQTRLAIGLAPSHAWDYQRSSSQEKHFPVCEYSWENEKRLYQEKLFPLCEALRQRGSEIAVTVYTGSLSKALGNYMASRDFHLIMMRGGLGLGIKRFFYEAIPLFRMFKRGEGAPVLLLYNRSKAAE